MNKKTAPLLERLAVWTNWIQKNYGASAQTGWGKLDKKEVGRGKSRAPEAHNQHGGGRGGDHAVVRLWRSWVADRGAVSFPERGSRGGFPKLCARPRGLDTPVKVRVLVLVGHLLTTEEDNHGDGSSRTDRCGANDERGFHRTSFLCVYTEVVSVKITRSRPCSRCSFRRAPLGYGFAALHQSIKFVSQKSSHFLSNCKCAF